MKNKKFLLILLLSILINQKSNAQYNFQRVLGGPDHERAESIFSTFDNGFIVNGATFSYGAGDVDAMLIKTDNQGLTLWSKTYGTSDYDNSETAIEAFDHSIVCVGRTIVQSGGFTTATMFKTDSAGNLLWAKSYGGTLNDGLVQIIETADHGYAAIGVTETISSGSSDVLFIRTDVNGDTIFTRSYGTNEYEAGYNVIQLSDNGFLISGRQITFPGGNSEADGLLLRTDSSGNLLWTKMYGDSLWEELIDVKQTPDSGFIAAGSTVTFGAGSYDILLMKTDGNGDVEWSKTFGGAKTDAAYAIDVNPDSSFILSGYTESLGYGHRGDDSSNIYLMKTSYTGDLVWMEVYGDGLQDESFRFAKAPDGGYVIPGFTTNYIFNDSSNMIFIKTDSAGLSGCHESSVQPIDSVISMPYQSVSFNQLSGISFSPFTLTENLAAINNDNACLFSEIKSVSGDDYEIEISPNPFNQQLQIKFKNDLASGSVLNIYDVYGKLLKTVNVDFSNLTMDTGFLKSGIYFFTLRDSNERRITKLLVKH
jgi:hypothetical protein